MTRVLLGALLGGVFLWAGVHKCLEPLAFSRVVLYLMPDGLRSAPHALGLGIGLAMLELALGMGILLWPRKKCVLAAALILFGGFGLVLGYLAASAGAPSCGCLSLVMLGHGPTDAALGLLRNAGLAWIACCLLRWRDEEPVTGARSVGVAALPAGRAFTLVELLVVVLVAGVLLALALPGLREGREAGRAAKTASTCRQVGTALGLYCQAHQEGFPYFGTPGDPLGPIVVRGVRLPQSYFKSQRWYWISAVVPEYLEMPVAKLDDGTQAYLEEMRGPEWRGVFASHFNLSSTVFAEWRYWRSGPAEMWNDPTHLHQTRTTDVAHPGRKGLVLTYLTGHGGPPPSTRVFPVFMADGSVRAPARSEFETGRAVERPFGAVPCAVDSTLEGLAGWDF
ncbi:MAG TPA: MauE/DoxX family redox-associated membrane protein [Phycisphaerales bacterium]|nr:MauE/DoxX family redox-associated membrane protein [Phycisphaerales bacterium]